MSGRPSRPQEVRDGAAGLAGGTKAGVRASDARARRPSEAQRGRAPHLPGYSYKGAAHALHVSVNAVKHQVGPLFETFEVHDRESFLKKVARLMGEDSP